MTKEEASMQDVYKALCQQNITSALAQWLTELDSDICDLKKEIKKLKKEIKKLKENKKN